MDWSALPAPGVASWQPCQRVHLPSPKQVGHQRLLPPQAGGCAGQPAFGAWAQRQLCLLSFSSQHLKRSAPLPPEGGSPSASPGRSGPHAMAPLRWCLPLQRRVSTLTAAGLCWQPSRGSNLPSHLPAWQKGQSLPGWLSSATGASCLSSSGGALLAWQPVRRSRKQPWWGQARARCLPNRSLRTPSAQEA